MVDLNIFLTKIGKKIKNLFSTFDPGRILSCTQFTSAILLLEKDFAAYLAWIKTSCGYFRDRKCQGKKFRDLDRGSQHPTGSI
jgi:hypothetical protein